MDVCLNFQNQQDQQSWMSVFIQLIYQCQVATRGTSPDVTTVFHALLYCRFIEIQSNLRRKKRLRMNQGSNFLGGMFNDRDNARAQIQFRREINPSISEDDFFLRTDPSILHQ